jgi:hypothetical protein
LPNESIIISKPALKSGTAPVPDTGTILTDYFTEIECGRALDLAPITLAIWRMQRKGPPVTRIGRRIYYRKASVRAWLESQEKPPCTFNPATA